MGFDLYRHRATAACAAPPPGPVPLAQDADMRDRHHLRAESVRATLMMIDSQQKISVTAAVFTFTAATARHRRNPRGFGGIGHMEVVVFLFTTF